MRTRTRAVIAAIIITLASACAGGVARERVLLPAMRSAWPSIRLQAEHIATPVEAITVAAMDQAMQIGTEMALASADWQAVKSLAVARIYERTAAGEIGPGVAASLSERVNQFDRAFRAFITRKQ